MAAFNPTIPEILPHGKMYNLQIGDKLFVLSGASLSSDAPSYFTNYFQQHSEDKPLFIDRSPEVFQYIYSHLQGYHIEIPNGDIFTRVYSDSIYYNLPRLKELLPKDDYFYIQVMTECIKVPKKILKTPGNSPNFFSVTFEALYRDLSELMISKKLIRPPPQATPRLNRDAGLLKDLIKLLQGVKLELSDEYRRQLISEARYYRFNSIVEQLSMVKIIKDIENPKHEYIVVKSEDVRYRNFVIEEKSGRYFDEGEEEHDEPRSKKIKLSDNEIQPLFKFNKVIEYKRAWVDDYSRGLIVELETPDIIGVINMDEINSNKNGNLVQWVQFQDSAKVFLVDSLLKGAKNLIHDDYENHSNFLENGICFIQLQYEKDQNGLLHFNDVDFNFNGENSQINPINPKLFQNSTQLLFRKSHWRVFIKVNDYEKTKLEIELIPVKIDAVLNTRASLYNALI